MPKITPEMIRRLRKATGAPMLRVKKVLEEFGGNEEKAEKKLKKEGFEKALKRSARATNQGVLMTYTHHSGKLVAIVELFCETDFVAKNELFGQLAKDLAMQVASMGAKNEKELLSQPFIKDPSKKVEDLLKDTIAKTGENIRLGRLFRLELGKK